MKLDHPGKVNFPSHIANVSQFTATVIDEADMGLAQDFFASIYTQRRDAIVRELSANALDAHRAAGNTEPIEVELPNGDEDSDLVITDFGTGMPLSVILENAVGYLKSLKRSNPDAIGQYGVGLKTPFSMVDWFTIISTHKGTTNEVVLTKLPTGGTGYLVRSSQVTGEPSGTKIIVPVTESEEWGTEDAILWREAAQRTFYWWNHGTVLVNGFAPQSFRDQQAKFDFGNTDTVTIAHRDAMRTEAKLTVLVNGIGYAVPDSMQEIRTKFTARGNYSVVIDAGQGRDITVARNRESIEDTAAALQWLNESFAQWMEILEDRVETHFEHAATARQLNELNEQLTESTQTLLYAYTRHNLDALRAETKNFVQSASAPLQVYIPATDEEKSRIWKYDKQPSLIWYYVAAKEAEAARRRVTLSFELLDMMLNGAFITPHEFSKLKKTPFDRWRKDSGVNFTLTVIDPDHPDLYELFTEAEVEWINAADLSDMFPSPQRKKATPDKLMMATDYSVTTSRNYGIPVYQRSRFVETLVCDVRAAIPADHEIVAGTIDEINAFPIDPETQTLIARGSRSTKAVAELLQRKVITPEQALNHRITAHLELLSLAERRKVIAIANLFGEVDRFHTPMARTWSSNINRKTLDVKRMVRRHRDALSKDSLRALAKLTLNEDERQKFTFLFAYAQQTLKNPLAPKDLFAQKHLALTALLQMDIGFGTTLNPVVLNAVVDSDIMQYKSAASI